MTKRLLSFVGVTAVAILYGACSSSEPEPQTQVSNDAGVDSSKGPPKKKTARAVEPTGPCAPYDVKDFEPSWLPPIGFGANVCTEEQSALLLRCLITSEHSDECNAAYQDPKLSDCFDCLVGDYNGTYLGVLISEGEDPALNIAGCIANAEGDTSDSSCGAKLLESRQCPPWACDCYAADEAGAARVEECIATAKANTCKALIDEAKCSEALLAGTASMCKPSSSDLLTAAKDYAKLFCGPKGDGGTDASTDAPKDAPKDG